MSEKATKVLEGILLLCRKRKQGKEEEEDSSKHYAGKYR
jgi:hypothetical protein